MRKRVFRLNDKVTLNEFNVSQTLKANRLPKPFISQRTNSIRQAPLIVS